MQVLLIPGAATHDLRRRVLRDGRADAEVVFAGDGDEGTVHFGAVDGGDTSPASPSLGTPSAQSSGGGTSPASHPPGLGTSSAERRGIVAIASLYRAPLKDQSRAAGVAVERQYQFRGMASAPEARGKGYADAVMRAMIAHMRGLHAGGGVLLWCNARVGAVGFYERFGMRVVGERFEIAGVGTHVVMVVGLEGTVRDG